MILHLAAAVLAPALVAVLGRRAFLPLALAPGAAFVWTLLQSGTVSDGDAVTQIVPWIPGLDLELAFRLGTLQWVLALLVTGVGTLVLLYCAAYFDDDEPGLASFAGVFTAFAGAMLGLVLADDLLLLYVFWELTTVFSYLLVGHQPTSKKARAAAMQALLVTTFGGLAMLVGILLLGVETGTYRISAILAMAPTGTTVTVAVTLLLLGALTKSAQVPFHFWLPGAMAAPTPVSAYLHAAAMVKAGVYLVALFAPVYADAATWRWSTMGVGAVTMIIGGWRALRQTDLKLLLAYGTVSQLGFLVLVVGTGTRAAAVAGLAMVVAHALFKATLFLSVGVIDHTAGTRDLRKLSGLGRAEPVLAVVATLAAASMAGLPPLAGFVAKESVLTALTDVVGADGDGTGLPTTAAVAVFVAVVAGSALTVAYSARFVWGAFATKPGLPAVRREALHHPSPFFLGPATILTSSGLALGFLGGQETELLQPYAELFPAGAYEPELTLWHGFTPALGATVVSVVVGLALFARRDGVWRFQRRVSPTPDAEAGYRWVMRGVDRLAVEVTGATQRGSLAIHLSVILAVLVALPGGIMLTRGLDRPDVIWWDTPAQALVVAVVAVAALLTARSRRRLKAVVLAGVTGYGTAMLFLLHGAPDLALTQVLVETVTVVIFVLVLRRLPVYFTNRPFTLTRYWRMAIGALCGIAVAGFALAASSARTAEPISEDFAREAYDFGGGYNIVNVTLVDIRAWDTMGEIAVLAVAATGVASMVFISTRRSGIRRAAEARLPAPGNAQVSSAATSHHAAHSDVWLPGGSTLAPERRSIIFEVVTRLAFPTTMIFSVYLLFSGHNQPGGGFAGGLVAGLALMVRYLAGGRYELDEAAPVDAGAVLGSGLALAVGAGLVPLAFGGQVLQSVVIDVTVPVLGNIHAVSSLGFDIGVYLVVVGLMLDILRSLGSGIDRHLEDADAGSDDDTDTTAADTAAPAHADPGAGLTTASEVPR